MLNKTITLQFNKKKPPIELYPSEFITLSNVLNEIKKCVKIKSIDGKGYFDSIVGFNFIAK